MERPSGVKPRPRVSAVFIPVHDGLFWSRGNCFEAKNNGEKEMIELYKLRLISRLRNK
jgi:hypothetical protein